MIGTNRLLAAVVLASSWMAAAIAIAACKHLVHTGIVWPSISGRRHDASTIYTFARQGAGSVNLLLPALGC